MRFIKPMQVSRRTVQIIVVALILITPILARYTNYLSARQLDKAIERMDGSLQAGILETTDSVIGNFTEPEIRDDRPTRNRKAHLEAARQLKGTTWSFELFGVTLTDPLAACESALASGTVRWVLVAGILIPVILTVLLGRIFCSWICPVGFFLELTDKLRGVLRFLEIAPGKAHLARANKYLLLFVGLGAALMFGIPFLGYFYPPALLGREVHNGITVMFDRAEEGFLGFSAAGLTLASWFLLGIAVVEIGLGARMWCRSLCPGGAVYALLGRWRLVRVGRDSSKCTKCGECVMRCGMGLSPMTDAMGMECDNCAVCISHCPDNALGFHLPGWRPDDLDKIAIPSTDVPEFQKEEALS
jgi:ferredoxin-type protein NapH